MRKSIFFSLLFSLSVLISVQAQEWYLSLSSTNTAAQTAYFSALSVLHNAQYEKYEQHMKMALKEDPSFFMAHAHQAFYHFVKGNTKAAEKWSQQTLALPVTNLTPAEKSLREFLEAVGNRAETDYAGMLAKMAKENADNAQAQDMAAAYAMFVDKDAKTAYKYVKKAVRLRSDYGPYYNLLGYTLMDLERMDQAKNAFVQYIKLAPEQANAYDSMADYFKKNGQYDQAALYYDKAANLGMRSSMQRADEARKMYAEK